MRLTRPLLVVLIVLILAPWGIVIFLANRPGTVVTAATAPRRQESPIPAPPNNRITFSQPGPWGKLEYFRIAVEPPEEFLYVDNVTHSGPHWFFKGYSRDQVLELFKSAGLAGTQYAALTQKARWDTTATGIIVSPDASIALSLSPPARARIYNVLAHFPENLPQNTATAFHPDRLDERFAHSGLSDAVISQTKGLLYLSGTQLLFCDTDLMLNVIPDHQERMRLLKTVSRKSTLLVKLLVDEKSNIDELVNYWGFNGRSKDIRPLLESLARIPGGGAIDITHLLPPFARKRIYTYPFPSGDPVISRRDCHWTSFNFFNQDVNNVFIEPGSVKKALDANFYPIAKDPSMGDILVLIKPSGELAHSAVYIADDIVFTKNGNNFTQPWIFMTLPEMMEFYSAFFPPEEPLKIICYHRKAT